MCPQLVEGSCKIAGVEPESVKCTDEIRCHGGEWDKCRVYVIQFFLA